jgi:hypothetical protein
MIKKILLSGTLLKRKREQFLLPFLYGTPDDTKFERIPLRHKGFSSHLGLVRTPDRGSAKGALISNNCCILSPGCLLLQLHQ